MVHFRLRQSIIDKFKTGEYGKPHHPSVLAGIKGNIAPPPPKWYDVISKPEPIKLRTTEELKRIGIIQEKKEKNLSLMSNPRVVRGSNTLRTTEKLKVKDKPTVEIGGKHKKRYSADGQTNIVKTSKRAPQHITTPRPEEGRENMTVQTDDHVERLKADYELFYEDVGIQTIPLHSFPPAKSYVPPVVENCKETQVEDQTMFVDIAKEHKEPLKNLCHEIVDRCLYELMDKYERQVIEKSGGIMQPTIEALVKKIQDIQIRENFVHTELKRFDKEQESFYENRPFISRIGEGMYTRSLMNDVTIGAINELRQRGHLDDPLKVAVRDELVPWLNRSVQRYFKIILDSRDILDEILRRVGETRSVEHCFTDHLVVDGEVIYANQYELLKRDKHLASFCEQIISKVEERDEFIQSVYTEVAQRKANNQAAKPLSKRSSETGAFSTHHIVEEGNE